MTPDMWNRVVEVVRNRLAADDPQLPAPDVRAERIVSDLFEAGLLAPTRRIERVETGGVL